MTLTATPLVRRFHDQAMAARGRIVAAGRAMEKRQADIAKWQGMTPENLISRMDAMLATWVLPKPPAPVKTVRDAAELGAHPFPCKVIQQVVAAAFGLKDSDIRCDRRTKPYIIPRQAAYWLCARLTDKSLPEIGRAFRGRDHTTILHGIRRIEQRMASDEKLADDVRRLEADCRTALGTAP